jgi:hypothetical protein
MIGFYGVIVDDLIDFYQESGNLFDFALLAYRSINQSTKNIWHLLYRTGIMASRKLDSVPNNSEKIKERSRFFTFPKWIYAGIYD